MKYEVVGLRIEKIVAEETGFEDYETEPCITDKYVILIKDVCNNKFELSLYEDSGWCGSGYCGASFGHLKIVEVGQFLGYTHKPKNYIDRLEFDNILDLNNECDIENGLFQYSDVGGCCYYPMGYVSVNTNLFEPVCNVRSCGSIRFVHIIAGKSDLGKSYFGASLSNSGKTVLEVDSLEDNLPNVILEDVIVLGGRHKHITIDCIKQRIFGEVKIVVVNFEEQ